MPHPNQPKPKQNQMPWQPVPCQSNCTQQASKPNQNNMKDGHENKMVDQQTWNGLWNKMRSNKHKQNKQTPTNWTNNHQLNQWTNNQGLGDQVIVQTKINISFILISFYHNSFILLSNVSEITSSQSSKHFSNRMIPSWFVGLLACWLSSLLHGISKFVLFAKKFIVIP